MKKFIRIVIAFLILLGQVSPLGARRRSRHKGGISQALNEQLTSPDGFFIQEKPVQLASIDKLSQSFLDTRREIEKKKPSSKEDVVEKKLVAKPVQNITNEQEVPSLEELALRQTLPAQVNNYELPKELQKTITEQLAKIEEGPSRESSSDENSFGEEKIELQFEEADLLTFVKQIAEIFKVTFITDDAFDPLPKGGPEAVRALKGNKISFKTTSPISKQQAWNLFITFLNIAGFGIVQQPDPSIYRIQTIATTLKAPIPTFIGINYELLPENDEIVRYLYFVENAQLEDMMKIVRDLKSGSSGEPIELKEQKAFIVTDKSYNIRSLMAIIKELDKVTMPQAMSIVKLRQADADEVKKLYDSLTQSGEDRAAFRPFGARKQQTALFFPESAKIIAEPRTNSLILLGPKDAIQKIEEFIVKYVDVALDQPYSPLYTYQLQYANAKVVEDILTKTTSFGQNTEAGKAGGVRGNDKYFKPMSFTADESTNQLIIKADYNDYLMVKKVIDELDKPQAQVALDVLILQIDLLDDKELGTQIRSKVPGLDGILGQNVKFQTSGLRAGGRPQGIVTNNTGFGVDRLLGDLVNLVKQAPAGNTIVTLGQDIFGVWGIFQALRTLTNVQIVSNPFLFASNNTNATVSLGETKRVVSSTVVSGGAEQTSQKDLEAQLIVNIRPQINSDGMIVLSIKVDITDFTNPTDPTSATRTTRLVQTEAIISDKEILAIGGLVRNRTSNSLSKTPVLGDVPVIGWLFKNKQQESLKDSLLILISSKIIPPNATSDVNEYTKERLNNYRITMSQLARGDAAADPVHKLFFSDESNPGQTVGEFLFERQQNSQRRARRKKKQTFQDIIEGEVKDVQTAQTEQKKRRGRGRRRRRTAIEQPAIAPHAIQDTIAIAQAKPTQSITIAAPTEMGPKQTLPDRKRRTQSLSALLSEEKEKSV